MSTMALIGGLLLVTDAGVTVAWQEPVSALVTMREQSRMAGALRKAERAVAVQDRGSPISVWSLRPLAPAAARQRARTRIGGPIGRIELPTLNRSYVIVHGADAATLRKGPGQYADTPWPGQRGSVAIAGHRTTYLAPFRTLDHLRPGQAIVVRMPYGRFEYRVERLRIVKPAAMWVKRTVAYDRLVLTTCHPLYSAKRRLVVFARLVRMTPV